MNPNGMSVVDWARELLHVSISDLATSLDGSDLGPGPIAADSMFTPLPHAPAGAGGGLLSRLTLATTGPDIVRALMECIACDFSLALDRLRGRGHELALIRASGGGANSPWLMQLHADLSGLPVELVAQDEPGTFGAAILGGVASGVYGSVSTAGQRLVAIARRFEPDPDRGRLYADMCDRIAASRLGDPLEATR